jgi:putative membrane protein
MQMERSNRNLWIGLGVLAVVLLFALPALGGGMMVGRGVAGVGPFGVRPFVGPWMWGIWGAGLLLRLVFIGFITMLVVRLFRGRRRYDVYDDATHYAELTPIEILRRRFAAGEITREQYEDMLLVVSRQQSGVGSQ